MRSCRGAEGRGALGAALSAAHRQRASPQQKSIRRRFCIPGEKKRMDIVQSNQPPEQGICPVSGTRGKKVDTATVKCLLSVSLSEVQNAQYYFCRDADCPVVYFTGDGAQTFKVQDIRERVYQKEPDSDSVLVCYCFRYTVGDIRHEVEKADADSIVEAITAGIHRGQCACDWRNPQGDCCLGNVKTLIKTFSATGARQG